MTNIKNRNFFLAEFWEDKFLKLKNDDLAKKNKGKMLSILNAYDKNGERVFKLDLSSYDAPNLDSLKEFDSLVAVVLNRKYSGKTWFTWDINEQFELSNMRPLKADEVEFVNDLFPDWFANIKVK